MITPKLASKLLLLLATFVVAVYADPRSVVPLDGQWSFQLDPDDRGESERWYSSGKTFTDRIRVPGAWDAQGFGPETEKMRHNFIGKGWYRRTVQIPTGPEGSRTFLRFGGVYRSANAWVNGQSVGSHIGYVSEFEFDITPFVRRGETADVVVMVNSKQQIEIDPLMGCVDLPDHLFSFWGGIWGHVSLETRAESWLTELFVQSRYNPRDATISAKVAGARGGADGVLLEITAPNGQRIVERRAKLSDVLKDDRVELRAELPDAPLWTPETPSLHTAKLTLLKGTTPIDRVQTRFGVRTIEVRGTDFLLNGKKFYANGYGDDFVYAETISAPGDRNFYLERLKVAKSYGFNFVRHHSHFVAPEYYEACDEIGMFVSPELPIAYQRYYNRAKTPATLETYKREWTGAILRYRNHPSIFNWCMGNELWNGIAVGPDLYAIAKQLDPTRMAMDTDGLFPPGFIEGTTDRKTLDYYTIMFNILTMPLDNPSKFETTNPLKPIITHEEGNFVHFPRLDSIELYEKTPFKPFWLTVARDKIKEQGLLDEALRWSEVSEKLYFLCHKYNLEALRKNPQLSGYHWWLLQPWYPGSNGLVDVHRRPISITPEQVREINAPVVLLQDGLRLHYRGGESIDLKVSISNYSSDAIAGAKLAWRVTRGNQTIAQNRLDAPSVAQGSIAALAPLRTPLPAVAAPEKVRVAVELTAGNQRYTNSWETWLYPAEAPKLEQRHQLYASRDVMGLLGAYNSRETPSQGSLPAPAVYVARQPDARLLDAAERGASVVLLSPAGVFETDVTTWKSAWWLGVFEGDSNAGTFVYDSPVTQQLAPGGWCDDGWFNLLQGAQTVILDNLSQKPEVLIRALNTHSAPTPFTRGLEYDFMWRNKSLLFQTGVGRGSWIVSGLNFDNAMRRGGPEAPWLLTRLLAHAQSLPRPRQSLTIDTLRELVAKSPFAGAPVISGFTRTVSHFGETGNGITFRENSGPQLRIRQEEPLHHVEWETAAIPQGERTTIMFAGGFSFAASMQGVPGFSIMVNGDKVLEFNTSRDGREWKSPKGDAVLRYVPALNQPSWSETAGHFYLSLPGGRLKAGSPARIRVYSVGHENNKWFALNPYDDLLGSISAK